MHTYAFSYARPANLEEAEALWRESGDAAYLAGGMTLIPAMKQRLAAPSLLIDLARIAGIADIRVEQGRLLVGALARHVEVARSPVVGEAVPALALLAGSIGDPAVRNRGTIGGSLANNDPSADYPSGTLALNATIRTTRREIPADEFFVAMFTTALDEGEIIVEVSFELPTRAGYSKIVNPASRYAMAGVFVAQFDEGVRVAVTGAGPGVFRLHDLESALEDGFDTAAVDRVEIPEDELNADIHGSSAYRAQLVRVAARRAVSAALGHVESGANP